MSSELKHIIPEEVPTEQELRDYLSGNLTPNEQNRIERIAASNPMVSEALEGLRLSGNPDAVKDIQKSVARRSGLTFGTTLKIAGLIGVALILATLVFMNQRVENQRDFADSSLNEVPVVTPDEDVESAEVESEIAIHGQRHTDSSVSVVISAPKQVDESPRQYRTSVVIESLQTLDPMTYEIDEDEISEEPVELRKPENGQRIYHVDDYKLVDYRGKREEPFNVLSMDLGGLPAKYTSQDEMDQDAVPQIQSVPYVDYVEGAIVEFSSGKFRKALNKFERILETYPDDANGLFYGGLTNYHLGRFEEAVKLFELVGQGDIETFREDGEFYLAKSFWELGQKEKAIQIFKSIRAGGGFYSEQAEKWVD